MGEDIAQYAEALPKLAGVGMKIPRAWAHDKLRIPEPDGKEDILSVPRPEMAAPPALRELAAGRAPGALRYRLAALAGVQVGIQAHPDAIDPATQLAPLINAQAQPVMERWMADIERLLQERPELTATEIQQHLLDLYGDLPTDQLVELMAEGYLLASLVGMDDIERGA